MPHPPRHTTYNLQGIKTAVGAKAQDFWDLVTAVRPTVLVGDLSALSPAHQPPTAAVGFLVPSVAARFTGYEIHSRGPGGCFVLFHDEAGVGGQLGNFEIRAATAGFANAVVATPQVFSNTAPITTVTSGDLAVAVGPVRPQFLPQGLWIPPGQFLVFTLAIANILLFVSLTIADVPVSEGEA